MPRGSWISCSTSGPAASSPRTSMPADSDLPVRLPHTFRPLGVRVVISVVGVLLLLLTGAMWLAFPPEIRDEFTTFQKLTVFALGVGLSACESALARSGVGPRERGVTVVTASRPRRYE